MKKFKNSFGVKGSPSLLQALKEEVEKLGWKYDKDFNLGYSKRNPDLYFNAIKPKVAMKSQHFSFSNVGNCIIYNLPEQWDECLKAASELEEEAPEYVKCIQANGLNYTLNRIYEINEKGSVTTNDGYKPENKYIPIGYYDYYNFETSTKEAYEKQQEELKIQVEIAGYSVKFEDGKVSIGCYKDITLKQLKTLRKAIKIVNDLGNDLTITEDGIIEHRDDNQISLEEIEQLIERLDG